MQTIQHEMLAVQGTRKERYAARLRMALTWLQTEVGKVWLRETPADERRQQIGACGIQVADVDWSAAANYVKSAAGTWAIQAGSRANALTRAECESRGLTPGPGNN